MNSEQIDLMIADLKAAGWSPKTPTIWKSPQGKLFLGPAGAWRCLRKIQPGPPESRTARQRLIRRAMHLRTEIEQIFIDCAYWNDHSHARKAGANAIEADPHGTLRRIADGIDHMLAAEARRIDGVGAPVDLAERTA